MDVPINDPPENSGRMLTEPGCLRPRGLSGYFISIGLLLSSCTTPYQPKGVRGGYWETGNQLGYAVHFGANEMTSKEAILSHVLKRASELCPDGFEELKPHKYIEKRGGDEAIMYIRCQSQEHDASTNRSTSACIPGSQTECACAHGRKGFQVCDNNGTRFGQCHCD